MMSRLRATLLPLLACTLLLSGGCGDSAPTDLVGDLPADLLATWFGSSLMVNGTDIMVDGARVRLTFRADGSFEIVASSDLVGAFCEGVFDCAQEGDFTATDTEVVFDPDEDPTTLAATITPTTLRLVGSDQGDSFDLSFVTVPIPDLIGTWLSTNLFGTDGVPLLAGGSQTTLTVTLEADGSYFFASTFSPPDLFCDVGLSCLGEGLYTVDGESGQITFDPNDVEPTTLEVSATGGSLRMSGLSGGDTGNWGFIKLNETTPGEGGLWFGISVVVDGVDLTVGTSGGSFQRLTVNEATRRYYMETTLAPEHAALRNVCGFSVAPDCTSLGDYSVTGINQLFVTDDDDVSQTPTPLTMTATPLTLRLVGTLGLASFDVLYVRVSSF